MRYHNQIRKIILNILIDPVAVVNVVLILANQKLSAFFPFQLEGLESPNVLHQDLSNVLWMSKDNFLIKLIIEEYL